MKCSPLTGLPTRRSLLATAADRQSRVRTCMAEARRLRTLLTYAGPGTEADRMYRDLRANVRYAREMSRVARDLRRRANEV